MNSTHFTPQPPEPAEAVRACEGFLERARRQLNDAQTPLERMQAELWIDNAERNLIKWEAIRNRSPR